MRVLFICTAHNSLSQRLALHLTSLGHSVTVELALSPEIMIEAAEMAQPDVILCPFLTKRVPVEVYTKFMTLIVHPGPPGDAGPSSLDLALMGDAGELDSWEEQLSLIDFRQGSSSNTSLRDLGRRSHWGVTVLQAIEKLDGGPIWAFEQFALSGSPSATLTKSELYRGPVSTAAVAAVQCALDRLTLAHAASLEGLLDAKTRFSTSLNPPPSASKLSVTTSQTFQGGKTHERPLLKASQRDFLSILPSARRPLQLSSGLNPVPALNANVVVQRINAGDSQPGVLSTLFGSPLFLYGAKVQTAPLRPDIASKLEEASQSDSVGQILATRQNSVLVYCGCDYPIWIESLRKPKAKSDKYLAVKLPAEIAIKSIGSVQSKLEGVVEWDDEDGSWSKKEGTYQQVWIDYEETDAGDRMAFVYFDFYNGATSTSQSKLLSSAISHALSRPKIVALCLMGGPGYFSNGIALNVIEGHDDPAAESWANINAIDDCVRPILCPSGVLTFAALRGNAAAGGLALASCCDVVLSSRSAVLNPHYRALGLTGSEYHSWSWPSRCGASVASSFMEKMLPMSAQEGLHVGLIDALIGEEGDCAASLDNAMRSSVRHIMNASKGTSLETNLQNASAKWTKPLIPDVYNQDLRYAEQLLVNKEAYLTYRFTSNKKQTRMTASIDFDAEFAKFRRTELEGMRLDFFHPIRSERYSRRRVAFVRKLVPSATPLRFALHRRFGSDWAESVMSLNLEASLKDEEELESFDSIGDIPDSEAVIRMPGAEHQVSQPLSPDCASHPQYISRSESAGTVPTFSFSNSQPQSVAAPSTAATSPAASRRPSLVDYKSLEQEIAEENSQSEAPMPIYPVSPRPSTITFAPTSPKQAQIPTSVTALKLSAEAGSRPLASKGPIDRKSRDLSHRFNRLKSMSWFRNSNERDLGEPVDKENLKKKRSTTFRFFDTISTKGSASVSSGDGLPERLSRRRSIAETRPACAPEVSEMSKSSIGGFAGSRGTQTVGRSGSSQLQSKQQRPSTSNVAPEHAFGCYYSEDGGLCTTQNSASRDT